NHRRSRNSDSHRRPAGRPDAVDGPWKPYSATHSARNTKAVSTREESQAVGRPPAKYNVSTVANKATSRKANAPANESPVTSCRMLGRACPVATQSHDDRKNCTPSHNHDPDPATGWSPRTANGKW